jgi:hypothetical protein
VRGLAASVPAFAIDLRKDTIPESCAEACAALIPFEDTGPPMTAILISLYVSAIILVAAFLFAALRLV